MSPPRISLFASMRPLSRTVVFPIRGLQPAVGPSATTSVPQPAPSACRTFSSTSAAQNWLQPRRTITYKDRKGRPRVPTGGSIRGTTVVWGEYGLRMRDHDRRISAAQLKNGEDVIRRRLRGINHRLYTRIVASTAVFEKGNESRMGTGKGSFDHWAARVAVSRVIFEVTADCHEQIIRDALRLAANKMPGLYEFVKKGDPPVMGITKLTEGMPLDQVMRPRKQLPGEATAGRLPGSPPQAGSAV